MTGENINLLTESEWRTIHNALSVYQVQATARLKPILQELMDKVRDNYIAPYAK